METGYWAWASLAAPASGGTSIPPLTETTRVWRKDAFMGEWGLYATRSRAVKGRACTKFQLIFVELGFGL